MSEDTEVDPEFQALLDHLAMSFKVRKRLAKVARKNDALYARLVKDVSGYQIDVSKYEDAAANQPDEKA